MCVLVRLGFTLCVREREGREGENGREEEVGLLVGWLGMRGGVKVGHGSVWPDFQAKSELEPILFIRFGPIRVLTKMPKKIGPTQVGLGLVRFWFFTLWIGS